jgi:hypothetical protein
MGKLLHDGLATSPLRNDGGRLGAPATTYQVPMDILAWIPSHFVTQE